MQTLQAPAGRAEGSSDADQLIGLLPAGVGRGARADAVTQLLGSRPGLFQLACRHAQPARTRSARLLPDGLAKQPACNTAMLAIRQNGAAGHRKYVGASKVRG